MTIPYTLAASCVATSLATAILRVLRHRHLGYALKCAASVLFFAAALFALRLRTEPVSRPAMLIIIGLALGLVGDVFLGLAPLVRKRQSPCMSLGGVAFFFGHLFFIAALLADVPMRFPLLALLPVVPLLYFLLHKTKILNFGRRLIPILGYGLMLGTMMLASFNYALHISHLRGLPIGILLWFPGALFVISDTSLFLRNFGNEKVRRAIPVLEFTVMLPYFSAQAIFALAVAVV